MVSGLFLLSLILFLIHLAALPCTRAATGAHATLLGAQNRQKGRGWRLRGPRANVYLVRADALGGLAQGEMVDAALATRASAVLGNRVPERIGSQMGNLAKEIDG